MVMPSLVKENHMASEEIIKVAKRLKPSSLPDDNRDGGLDRLTAMKAWNAAVQKAANVSEQRARTAIVKVLRQERNK